jgi:hypothetical protein
VDGPHEPGVSLSVIPIVDVKKYQAALPILRLLTFRSCCCFATLGNSNGKCHEAKKANPTQGEMAHSPLQTLLYCNGESAMPNQVQSRKTKLLWMQI